MEETEPRKGTEESKMVDEARSETQPRKARVIMTKRTPKTRWLIAILATAMLLLSGCSLIGNNDDSPTTTATSSATKATTATDDGGGTTDVSSDDLAHFVPRELAEGEELTAIAGTCVEGDVTVILTAGARPVFDDLSDTGHLTCFNSPTNVVSTYASHISAATRDEHVSNMLHLAGQCGMPHGCPRLHVLVCEDGAIVEDYWANR